MFGSIWYFISFIFLEKSLLDSSDPLKSELLVLQACSTIGILNSPFPPPWEFPLPLCWVGYPVFWILWLFISGYGSLFGWGHPLIVPERRFPSEDQKQLIHSLIFSHIGHSRVLSRVPCAIQRSLLVIYFIIIVCMCQSQPSNLSLPPFPPLPGNHKLIFYICNSISVL